MSDKQRTLKKAVTLQGVGLHTGETVELTLQPAPENHGYKFQRVDLEGEPVVPADIEKVVDTNRGTTLENDGVRVHTTEHVLAALYANEVDNALIQLSGPEVPIMDGSSRQFVNAINEVGLEEQEAERKYFVLDDNLPWESEEGGTEMLAVPAEEFRLTVMVDYKSPVLGTQHASMYRPSEFNEEISDCRTFVFLKELESLAKNNLIKGGDLDNAIVLVEREEVSQEELDSLAKLLNKEDLKIEVKGIGVLNSSKLKFENEPARHKLLDIVGDLALIGRPIKAHILAARPGHGGNVAFGAILKKHLIEAERATPSVDLKADPIYDINDISNMLPHRYPFLMVDKIMAMDDKTIVGVKNVTTNEPFFEGHFPGNPVMPGVLQIEAMAQVGGIFALSTVPDPEKYITYFMKIDKVRFKRKVIPGDTVVFHLELLTPIRRGIVHMRGTAYVNDEPCTEAEMLAQIVKEKE